MADPRKANPPADLAAPTTPEGVRDLLKRAAAGDPATAPAVRKLLEHPENIDRLGGDLAGHVQRAFVDALSGKDVAVREATHAKLAALRKELLGADPTPVERLLAERAVACWLQVQDADFRAAAADSPTIKQADFYQRRMDAANRRYLAALKTLALVRKLAVPAVQVNIAKRQVNVVAPVAATPPAGG